jgi:hypothetical protein
LPAELSDGAVVALLDFSVNGFCPITGSVDRNTELDSMVDMETFNVDVLSHSQIVGIINKTSADAEKAKSLCEALDRSPLHKGPESILKSPILVVLFCVTWLRSPRPRLLKVSALPPTAASTAATKLINRFAWMCGQFVASIRCNMVRACMVGSPSQFGRYDRDNKTCQACPVS